MGGSGVRWMDRVRAWLAEVVAVPPGVEGDGLVVVGTAGTGLDKSWDVLYQEFTDAREAWRRNPLVRRLVQIVTAYVVGDGISLSAADPVLHDFLRRFWSDPQNRMALRQAEWCDELTRSGELFITLHTNPVDGMSYVRPLPASGIDRVAVDPGDYEREVSYHEAVPAGDPDWPAGRVWWAAGSDEGAIDGPLAGAPEGGPQAAGNDAALLLRPVCLHFAINRPVGCVRGESDLVAILPWAARYSRWLEDRLRLNAAVRAFLWIVRVPEKQIPLKREQYRTPPEPGTVMVVDRQTEEWQAVAPSLHAHDAAADGRAIRWMVAAGGPGIGLTDLGEAETSTLATARAMAEMRVRFMQARQAYFGNLLVTVALTAYNRAVRLGKVAAAAQERCIDDIEVHLPDVSPGDNLELARSAEAAAQALRLRCPVSVQTTQSEASANRSAAWYSAGSSISVSSALGSIQVAETLPP